ncbi:MAG: hypothetical protein WHS46_00325 [Desulfosoma sp.]
MRGMLYALWRYHHFVWSSNHNEQVRRFARNKLGGLRRLINPLAQVLIYALILPNAPRTKLPGIDNGPAWAICWAVEETRGLHAINFDAKDHHRAGLSGKPIGSLKTAFDSKMYSRKKGFAAVIGSI